MHRFAVTLSGISCNVSSEFFDARSDPLWRTIAEPYCVVTDPVERPWGQMIVRSGSEDERQGELAEGRGWTDLMLHGEMPGRQAETSTGAVFENFVNRAVYAVAPGNVPRLEIMYAGTGEDSLVDAFRVLRGWLTMEHEQRGSPRCHAAAASIGGVGIALVGPKGAGKTSFNLTLMRHPDVAYVTNDKALVHTDGDAPVVVGLPYAVSIGHASLRSIPELTLNDGFIVKDKLYVWPPHLAERLSCRVEPATHVSAVFECRLDLASTSVRVEALHERDVGPLLVSAVSDFGGGDRINPDWLGRALAMSRNHQAPLSLGKVPWFRVSGNPWRIGWRDSLDQALADERVTEVAR